MLWKVETQTTGARQREEIHLGRKRWAKQPRQPSPRLHKVAQPSANPPRCFPRAVPEPSLSCSFPKPVRTTPHSAVPVLGALRDAGPAQLPLPPPLALPAAELCHSRTLERTQGAEAHCHGRGRRTPEVRGVGVGAHLPGDTLRQRPFAAGSPVQRTIMPGEPWQKERLKF